jgi:hypothetical protein
LIEHRHALVGVAKIDCTGHIQTDIVPEHNVSRSTRTEDLDAIDRIARYDVTIGGRRAAYGVVRGIWASACNVDTDLIALDRRPCGVRPPGCRRRYCPKMHDPTRCS